MNKLKVGAAVKGLQTGETGIVTRVTECDPVDPINNHGTIEVKVTNPGRCRWIKAGDLEHYSHFGWDRLLEVLE